ncbi:MAG: hypothetical protein AB7F35_06390 [Acetobacteraceae bacterium]
MALSGSVGARLYTTSSTVAATVDTEAEWFAQTWTEIGSVEAIGEFGRQWDAATFIELYTGRTHKFKSTYNDGQIQITMGQDLSDAGQATLDAAAIALSQDNYGFRIELNDRPSAVGGPTTFFFAGKPMSYRTQMGGASQVIRAMSMIEVDSAITYVDPAELHDEFPTGGSLAHYELFHGSDAQAADPVISSGTLSMVTGDAGTGFSDDGTQLIGDTGYTLAGGALTLECRLKVSAITTVAFFFGLTDQKAALEIPIMSAASADTITTNATDAIGFMFDTSMSTDNIWLVGVNNDVDETAQNSAVAPVADTFITLRIVTNTSGDATFFINGAQVGSAMTTAAATGVTLYPTIAAMARSTTGRTLTAEYLYLRQG